MDAGRQVAHVPGCHAGHGDAAVLGHVHGELLGETLNLTGERRSPKVNIQQAERRSPLG